MVQTDSDSQLQRGDLASDFRLVDTEGAHYTPDSFGDNDAMLVVFTCNHCPYAKAKFAPLNAIAEEYDDCAVVGINPNDADGVEREPVPGDGGDLGASRRRALRLRR